MKKINSLDNKLKLYSTLAMGVMGAGALNAQVVYHDVVPDTTLNGVSGTASSDTMMVNMDADALIDFQFQIRIYGTTPTNTQANLYILQTGNGILANLVSYTNLGYATDIPLGTAIGASSAWNTASQAVLASLFGTTHYGHLGDGAEHYMGVKFTDAAAAIHYGWIRVSGVNADGTHVTIKDWAYNSTADASINAGQTTSGVNEVSNINYNVYSNNKNVYINFTTEVNGNVNVYNSLGELVYTDKMAGSKNIINLSNLNTGIYMIRIESDKGSFIKKVKI